MPEMDAELVLAHEAAVHEHVHHHAEGHHEARAARVADEPRDGRGAQDARGVQHGVGAGGRAPQREVGQHRAPEGDEERAGGPDQLGDPPGRRPLHGVPDDKALHVQRRLRVVAAEDGRVHVRQLVGHASDALEKVHAAGATAAEGLRRRVDLALAVLHLLHDERADGREEAHDADDKASKGHGAEVVADAVDEAHGHRDAPVHLVLVQDVQHHRVGERVLPERHHRLLDPEAAQDPDDDPAPLPVLELELAADPRDHEAGAVAGVEGRGHDLPQ
mmetsp:Transcript_98109/g.297798  ORF Transcript_98109/g.297798 Transcript_98109/m.297798 type:complete len:275 (+) Transcript_98109:133-957(+)